MNKDEAALCAFGHHIFQDGLTQMQSWQKCTDEGRNPLMNDYFPFVDRKPVTFLQNMMIYITLPFGIYQTLKHYYSRPMDVNCIKKERYYLTGKYVSRNSPEISIKKLKQLSKKNSATLGDVMMSITSVVLNDYFE